MGGRVLELFSKDEEEAMLNSLSEEMLEGVKTPGGSKSADELRELFLKVSAEIQLYVQKVLCIHTYNTTFNHVVLHMY